MKNKKYKDGEVIVCTARKDSSYLSMKKGEKFTIHNSVISPYYGCYVEVKVKGHIVIFFTDKERTSHKPKFKDFFIMQKELRKKKLKKIEKQQQDKKR